MTTNKVKSHSTRSLLCLILFRKNIFCRGQSLDACYQRFMTKGCKYATKCQCPLGLIPHFYLKVMVLKPLKKPVSMPSRAYTSFLRYPFKNLGFMRFPEPVFAGIYQNILTTAVFRAC